MIWKVLNCRRILFACLLSCPRLVAAEAQTPTFAFDDFLLAPVRVHFLSAPDAPQLSTTLTDADLDRILGKINRIWAQAGLQFYLESLVKEAPQNAEAIPHPETSAGFRWASASRAAGSAPGITWMFRYHMYRTAGRRSAR